ncbi:hypothetical protein PSN45_004044 [Yamadazyma tenuis]|uniref:37S ribosomal protein S35, mitochondrial n=1 Tax=Candida tenuis (strain ATCC 10573 / BCRC 21748 / CBS 615 / JCM 9827 / NBRC 10315 / NRRL Y-1498 / VKM Y-70) TaxID=590646 RepID=G3B4V7_CANTC|nr:uncharacterized protein CANTEDRAFT_113903 [Yamadazyma tenuis ATCC 10573]XP_006686594.1 uncharacterized protein CANTEDRAFT_113903 [Yamadazyma tenuis ATCC 10573]EGV64279.1 hypothetical protein CANTEDRAFT_113903 [Yamadazyma tenuis ATCC 10573]EGV64280.1 hypothetical protein CANTEDRAFT_113903 [Yamadazyma tenuis ATCC 10573]WEJ96505.1 hypothetical protein PSN45_004044 [Yamadazyma tenuis]
MFSHNPVLGRSSHPVVRCGQLQHLRTLKRRLAYPEAYRPVVPPQTGKKDHSSYFQRALKGWLGPKNIRGEYYRNKYYYPPQNHKPRYIVQDGQSVEDGNQPTSRSFGSKGRDPALHPFPQNLQCTTAPIISEELKLTVYEDANVRGLKTQEIAQKYGIKLARVEAIIKLYEIERSWEENNKITTDLKQFSTTMYKMFPLFNPPLQAENLTEIPTPSRTLHQRFLTISESEPFGPVDAADIFGLEPASETLTKLTQIQDHSQQNNSVVLNKVLVGKQKEGDRTAFRFSHAQSGSVGYRYGASRRDRKKDKAIGFDRVGKLVNLA